MGTDALMNEAMAVWPDLAAQAGLIASDWAPSRLAFREDGSVARILVRLDAAGHAPLVLKYESRPVQPAVFADALRVHLAIQDACAGGVPEILSASPERQAVLMTHVPGKPLSVLLDGASLSEQCALLRRAGAWLSRFHEAMKGEPRVFQPKFTLNFLRQVLEEIADGRRTVIEPERFCSAAETLCAAQREYEGHLTQAAVTHGDMHMRNILVGTESVWGIDFAGGRVVPVGHDIGRLLADYAILRAPHAQVPVREVLPPAARAAFFEGYRLVGPDDPSVRLLIRHRVLAEWWGLPAMALSPAQARRWRGISALAARAFPEA